MTIVQLYPPIAAATFVVAIWLAVAYHFDRSAVPGEERWYHLLWYGAPPAGLLAFFYFQGKAPITSSAAVFPIACLGIVMGVMAAFLLRMIVLRSYEDRRHLMQISGFLILMLALFSGGLLFG